MNNNFLNLFQNEIKRNCWLIIFIGIIVATLLVVEKTFFSSFVVQSGNMHIEKTMKIEGDTSLNDNRELLEYQRFFSSYSGLQKFLDLTETQYDYSKFNSDWINLSSEDKLKWLQEHIIIVDFKGNVCQFIFRIKETEAKDKEYIDLYAERLLNDFVNLSEQRIQLVNSNLTLKEIDSAVILPEDKEISKKQIIFKYAVVGVFLGIGVGLIIVMVRTLRKKYND